MIQTHGRSLALTLTAGIDSTVMAYWLCEEVDKLKWLCPTSLPPGHRTKFYMIFAKMGQANDEKLMTLAMKTIGKLREKYDSKFEFLWGLVDVKMPTWSMSSGVFQQGFVQNAHIVQPKEGFYEDRTYSECFIDGRNMIFFAHLMSWCSWKEIPLLLTAHQYEDHEWDQIDSLKLRQEDVSPMFIDRLNLMNEVGFRNRTRIEAPFLANRWSKYDICCKGQELGIDLGSDTYSCMYFPACHKCENCTIRHKAFAILGIEDKQG